MPNKCFAVSLLFVLVVVSAAAAQAPRRDFPLQATVETGPRDWYISMSEARTEEGRQKLRKLIRGEIDLGRRLLEVVRLADAGDPACGKLLVRTYNEAEYRQDYEALEKLALALGDIAAAAATPRMIEATKVKEAKVRLTGVMVLGRVGDERAVAALIALLNDPNADVADAAMWALSNLTGQPPVVRSSAEWTQWWSDNRESLPAITALSIQRNVLTRAATTLKIPIFASPERAVKTLGAVGGKETILILAEAVRAFLGGEGAGTEAGATRRFPGMDAALLCRRITGRTFRLEYMVNERTANELEAWYNEHVKGQKPEGGER